MELLFLISFHPLAATDRRCGQRDLGAGNRNSDAHLPNSRRTAVRSSELTINFKHMLWVRFPRAHHGPNYLCYCPELRSLEMSDILRRTLVTFRVGSWGGGGGGLTTPKF